MAKYAVFDTAPVHEVAFSVQFANRLVFKSFDGPRIHRAFADRYPIVQEHAPLPEIIFPDPGGPAAGIQLVGLEEPRARWWFLTQGENELLQVQDDRFARNWRKFDLAPAEDYPGYQTLRDRFLGELNIFIDAIEKEGFGKATVTRCDLAYINLIPLTNENGERMRLKDAFSFLQMPSRKMNALQMTWFHGREEQEGSTSRLYKVDLTAGKIQDSLAANLTLTGLSKTSSDSLSVTFDEMHNVIHEYFQELIADELQNHWNKRFR